MPRTQTQVQAQTPSLFQVTLTVNADGPGDAEALRVAFGEGGPFLASPVTISADEGYVSILFSRVDDDAASPPADAAPGAEVIGALAGFSDDRLLVAALMKALLTFSSVRESAGLSPRRELRIDVVPAPVPRQNSLSVGHSDDSPDDFPQFRPRRRRRSDVARCGPPR